MPRTLRPLWQPFCFLKITEIASACDWAGAPHRPVGGSGTSAVGRRWEQRLEVMREGGEMKAILTYYRSGGGSAFLHRPEPSREHPTLIRLPRGQAGPKKELLFFRHHHRYLGDDIFVKLDRDLELAELLDGLVELDLAAIDGEILGGQRIGHILGSDRAK